MAYRLRVYRLEGGKATDALRRKLLKSLPQAENRLSSSKKGPRSSTLFSNGLKKISAGLDFDDPAWLREVSRHYLSRKEPKTDWPAQFGQIHSIRRSRPLDSGWEVDSGRLFLEPALFDEWLLAQYLISRAHNAGGLTLETLYASRAFRPPAECRILACYGRTCQ